MLSRVVVVIVAAAAAFAAAAGEQTSPGVTVSKAWARATPGGATIGAAYLEVTAGATDDRLIGAATPSAGRTELHTHIDDNGVMKMRRLDAIALKAGETHAFVPGGDHIMLFDLKKPLEEGAVLPLTLTFEKAGVITVGAHVAAIGSMGPASEHKH